MQMQYEDTPKQDNFNDMMMDTAGFQRMLEQSKKEEEERIKKQNKIKVNEDKLLERGLLQSQDTHKKEAQLKEQEDEMMR